MKSIKNKLCMGSCSWLDPIIDPKPKVEPPEWWDNSDYSDEED
jgi:hypothetical protein